MRLSLVFTHCLEKVFHRQNMPPVAVENRLSGLNNEVLSWQAVYCLQTRHLPLHRSPNPKPNRPRRG